MTSLTVCFPENPQFLERYHINNCHDDDTRQRGVGNEKENWSKKLE